MRDFWRRSSAEAAQLQKEFGDSFYMPSKYEWQKIPQKPPAPGKEVGLSFGHHFFAICEKNKSGSTASSGAAASAGATPQQPTEDDATEDLINLGFNMARHLSAALLHDRWQNHGQGIFVHGASGMLVQIKDKSSI